MDHLDAMDDLRGSIGLHAYAQRNPVTEYRIQGADMFDEMIDSIRTDTVRAMLSVVPRAKEEIKRVSVAKVTSEGFAGGKMEKAKPKVEKPKTTTTIMPQDIDADLEVVGKFEAPENVPERWTIVIASAAVVLVCVAVIVVVLILDKKKKTPPEHAGEEVKE
jgi:hypothetical protein